MKETKEPIFDTYIGFRAPNDFMGRFEAFTRHVGRSRSALARYLIGRCMTAYENDNAAIAKIRQEIL